MNREGIGRIIAAELWKIRIPELPIIILPR